MSQNQKAYVCRSGDSEIPELSHGIQDRRPRHSKHPSLLAMPAVFPTFSITLVGRFPELTPVHSQTTSRGFLPWMPVTLILFAGRSPRSPGFPTPLQSGIPRGTLSTQGPSRAQVVFSVFLVPNMGRFPELTPVRSQTIEPWFTTLEAGDITLLLEWMPTSTRELRGKEGGWSGLESGNERQGTRSPLVVGRGAPWLG